MPEYPKFEFSKKEVKRAGKALKGHLYPTGSNQEELHRIFKVANNWRASHALPMRSVRSTVSAKINSLSLQGVTAARLKTMPSIREKLSRLPGGLNQLQDLGGVRAVVGSIEDVEKLVNGFQDSFKHELGRVDDYITSPKVGGYRSFHLVSGFKADEEKKDFDGRLIEIQVRTRLQHSWATAVEAVGLIKEQDMKAGKGDKGWLRFFELMSAEFAYAEGCPIRDELPEQAERMDEINRLNDQLKAMTILNDIRHASEAIETVKTGKEKPAFYLLEYDHKKKTVNATAKYHEVIEFDDYGQRERENYEEGKEMRRTVLVEADKVGDLKKAYPNYFGDVVYFLQNLERITQGESAREYEMPPHYKTPPIKEMSIDPRWMYGSKRKNPWS